MRQVLLALVASLTVAAVLAGAGFGAGGRSEGRDLGGFGGHVARVRVAPLWREGSAPAVPPLHRVVCATAATGDTSACYAASTSR